MIRLALLASSFVFGSPAMAAAVPDFQIKVGQDSAHHWLLEFSPPAKHHFNLKAPMKVSSGDIVFAKVGQEPSRLGFQSSDAKPSEGADGKASLFLCDDAETYCINKTLDFKLKTNSDLHELSFGAQKQEVPSKKSKKKSKKDEYEFWDNDVEGAFAESQSSGKPVLVDFYGIWCPPCNLYNETVFNQSGFKALSKNWVLLKLDADKETSFPMKSHFKVGGYPTISLVKTVKAASIESLEEIDRIVGYYPLPDFKSLLDSAYASRNQSLEERLAGGKDSASATLKKLIAVNLEKKENEKVLAYAKQVLSQEPENHYFAIIKLQVEAKSDSKVLKKDESLNLLKAVALNREKEDPETLLSLITILTDHSESFSVAQIGMAKDAITALQKRINPKTLAVNGVELSIGDLSELNVEVVKALKDDQNLKSAYEDGANSYQKLISLQGGESRGLNLEYAFYLYQSGKVEAAKKVYDHFISKYPKEFTFYYAAARMGVEIKDLKIARENAEKAVQYAYGDNQIRSMDQLVRVLGLQGEKQEAIERGKKFLANVNSTQNLSVRTDRYLSALKKSLSDLEGKN